MRVTILHSWGRANSANRAHLAHVGRGYNQPGIVGAWWGGIAYETKKKRMTITVAPEPFDSADARRLIGALDAHLASRYPPEQRFGPNLKPAQIAPGFGTFVVARVDGRAVACGAVRLLDPTTVEVKRMYVEPEMRGRGVAKEILAQLEGAGRQLGAHRAVLETGVYQDEAIGLYRRAGYREVDCWGDYTTSPTSVCYEKTI
jgi:putative acetyltransferase